MGKRGRPKRQLLDPNRPGHWTPAFPLIDEHYRRIGLRAGWGPERFLRLCKAMNVTPYELGRICCVEPISVTLAIRNTKRFSRCASLHFAVIEAWFKECVLRAPGKKADPVLPMNVLMRREIAPPHD